jgi:hypothetical protein
MTCLRIAIIAGGSDDDGVEVKNKIAQRPFP